jgi:hypothetical protein
LDASLDEFYETEGGRLVILSCAPHLDPENEVVRYGKQDLSFPTKTTKTTTKNQQQDTTIAIIVTGNDSAEGSTGKQKPFLIQKNEETDTDENQESTSSTFKIKLESNPHLRRPLRHLLRLTTDEYQSRSRVKRPGNGRPSAKRVGIHKVRKIVGDIESYGVPLTANEVRLAHLPNAYDYD